MINRKRKRSRQTSVEKPNHNNNNLIISSKVKSKIKDNFIAKLRKENESINNNISKEDNEINEMIEGEDLIFEERKNKAKNLLEEIKKLNIDEPNNSKIIKNKINEVLFYDNTRKEILFKSLYYYRITNDINEFQKVFNKAKFGLTKKYNVSYDNKNENIDLYKEFNLSKEYFIFEDEETIIKTISNTVNYLGVICEKIKNINIKDLTNEKILKSKIIKNENGLFAIEKKNSKIDNLQKLYDDIYNYLYYYMFINDFQYYGLNQPIDYKYNSIIYLIDVFYRIYYNTTNLSKKGKLNYVNINENKMTKFYSLKNYIDHIFYLLKKNNNQINEEIDDKFDLFFFYLESDYFPQDLKDIIDASLEKYKPLNLDKIIKFIEDNNNPKKKYKLNKNILCLNYEGKDYEFKYENYNETLLNFLDNEIPGFIEEARWNHLSIINYFDEDDIQYLKGLLGKILKSKLFLEVYSKYANVQNYIDYYFNENKNIDDLLNRIKILPFKEENIGGQAGTIPRQLKIITSSLYVSNINNKKDFINYKLLEMGRKLIIILHEIIRFIKRALNLITNGKVKETTIESEKEDPDIIEAGSFFEQLVLNWENPYAVKKAKRANSSKRKKKEYNEEEEHSKNLNIRKALKLLDPNTYNKNIDGFKKYFESMEENTIENMDNDLKEYIKKINFDINDYNTNKNSYKRYKINCSRYAIGSYFIEYIPDNHNYPYRFNEPNLNFLNNKTFYY